MAGRVTPIPAPVITEAANGNAEALAAVVGHYQNYIRALATRPLKDEYGNEFLFNHFYIFGFRENANENFEVYNSNIISHCYNPIIGHWSYITSRSHIFYIRDAVSQTISTLFRSGDILRRL